jgi:hypothetical protein
MALADVVRSGIALANNLTGSFQVSVNHYAWISDNEAGEPQFAAPIIRQALHERKQRLIKTADSRELVSTSQLTIIGPVGENGAEGRREPIDSRDKIVFFSGESGKILNINGLDDPSTGRPYMYEVSLG